MLVKTVLSVTLAAINKGTYKCFNKILLLLFPFTISVLNFSISCLVGHKPKSEFHISNKIKFCIANRGLMLINYI